MRPALYPVLFRRPLRGGPDLDLNFAAMTVLDPRVTYSGASLSTLTNAAGAIAYKPHNLALYSDDLTNGWSGATATAAPGTSRTGGNSTRVQLLSGEARHRYTSPGSTYAITSSVGCWLKSNTGSTQTVRLKNTHSGFLDYFSPDLTVTTTWQFFSFTQAFTAAAGGGTVLVGVTTNVAGTAADILVGEFQHNLGPLQPYYPTTSAAYFGPRFTYDPVTHAALGLLIEEQRTNLLLQSNSLSTTWSAFGSAGISQNITGIDGRTTGWTLTDSNASMGVVQQQLALGATTYTLSAYVLKTVGAQSSYPVIGVDNGSTLVANATIDTSNGVATVWTTYTGWTVTTSSATCVSHNADYWRVTLTFLATATNWNIDIVPAGTTNATQSTGVLSASAQGSAGFTCLQLEAGAFATSYIPTTSASVTRAADSATMTGSNFSSWFNATNGTVAFEAISSNTGTGNEGVVTFDQDGNNTIGIGRRYAGGGSTNIGMFVFVGGVTQAYIQTGTVTPGTAYKVAARYALNNFAESVNGGAPSTDIAGTLPGAITQMLIGRTYASEYLNGTISRLRYYPVALTNAQLQALTT